MNYSTFPKLLVVLFTLSIGFHNYCNAQYRFQEYASLQDARGFKLIVLEWGVKAQYDGKVAWRITNNTSRDLFDVTIANQRYTMSDGRTINVTGQYMTSTLGAGTSKTIYKFVNSAENTGTYSNRNNNPVEYVALQLPNIRLKTNRSDARRTPWGDYGTVHH